MATPPSRKPAEHNGMADRKPIRYHPISNIDSCSRRLFSEDIPVHVPQLAKQVRSLRF